MDAASLDALSAAALYAVVWGLVLVESGVLPAFWLPGDTVLFAAGLIAARPGSDVSVTLLAAGTAVAACAGNGLGYWTGRRLGRPWLERRTTRVRDQLARAEALAARHGAMALLVARFIPWLRTFVPVLAGVTRMRYATVALATLAGAVVWGSGIVLLGYAAHFVPGVRHAASAVAGVFVAASVVMGVAGWVRSRRTRRRGAPPEPPA